MEAWLAGLIGATCGIWATMASYVLGRHWWRPIRWLPRPLRRLHVYLHWRWHRATQCELTDPERIRCELQDFYEAYL